MNKFVILALTIVLIFSFFACSANSSTGLIVVTNTSDIDAKNVKVGNYSVGDVGRGQAVNYYFVVEQNNAAITANGFNTPTPLHGTIDLKFNYVYDINFVKQGITLTYNAQGTKVGGTGIAGDTINMQ